MTNYLLRMSLTPGTKLGPYEIVSSIGAGGMGEVYKAQDTRLDRTVAIKVLPSHLADDADLRQRFEREARTVSSLNHPHICTLHDIGREGDVAFLVMEHIEGETLAERLKRGPVPLNEALTYAVQIAEALDKAHRQGVVHRDLKPGNVMLTKSGAKLLDFGLAKLASTVSGAPHMSTLSSLPTEQKSLTAAGTILGTFQYMAPEQLEGGEADARTDIFALGALIYEMVTRKKAFEGKSQASLISSIMSSEPASVSAVQPFSPAALDRIIRTCLAKDPDKRWQSAGDVARELEWIAQAGPEAAARSSAGGRVRERLAWGAAAAATLAAVVFAILWALRAPAPPQVVRFDVPPPEALPVVDSPKLSPDGRYLAFNGIDEQGTAQIWVRPLNAVEARPLPGTEGTTRPFWSPDGTQLGFFSGGKLKKIPVSGGPPQTICDAPTGADGAWNEDGVILYDGQADDPIMRVSATGGIPTPQVSPDGQTTSVGWPQFLPGGDKFLYVAWDANQAEEIRIGSLDGGEPKTVLAGLSRVEYSPPGYLLYVRENTLVAQPFDATSGETTGEPMPLAEDLGIDAVGLAHFSASRTGILAFRGGEAGGGRLAWADPNGEIDRSEGDPAEIFSTDLSPDGRWLAMQMDAGSGQDIWVRDLVRGVTSRFTFGEGREQSPIWSPDGQRIAFAMEGKGDFDLAVKTVAGGNDEILLERENRQYPSSWSPDGRSLLFYELHPDTAWDVWVLPLDGEDREPKPFLNTPFVEVRARFSPDGRWVAYESDESGRGEIYARSFSGTGGKWQISTGGGTEPQWSRDGRALYYIAPDLKMMQVSVQTGEAFEAGIPEPIFAVGLRPITTGNRFLLAADGRFLLLSSLREKSTPPTTLVLNWIAELGR
ncbi:MAG TPA: protein kinase [Vicinamibacteria bacterium]